MIDELRITNLGVIEEAHLPLHGGLTALTGETGAGKTMAVTSLQLLLGAKADSSKVRHGAEAAHVEGVFLVPATSPILEEISEAGGAYDVEGEEATLVIARHIPAKGRSRAFIGGRTVPTAVLTHIASSLVSVHGQSDQIRLATPAQQRRALDSFAGEGVTECLLRWKEALAAHMQACARLREHEERAHEAVRERIALEALLAKVEEVNPYEGEDEELKAEAARLENSDALFAALSGAAAEISGSDTVDSPALAGIEHALAALLPFSEDPQIAQACERLESVRVDLSDLAGDLALTAAHVEADPERLHHIYTRRQELAGLRKDLMMGIDEILDMARKARESLASLAHPEATRERLAERVEETDATCQKISAQLTALRREAALRLQSLVQVELPELSLADARFEIRVESGSERTAHGTDTVAFLLASHAGAPLTALGEGASGGELSRLMLAVEVSLASVSNETGHTFLFDEVDAGVGGRAALSVGRRLAKLAESAQILLVTHLAQVAAYASTQAIVEKNVEGGVALTHVREVQGEERLAELARMLAGNDTEAARAHAAELLSDANMAR